MQRMQAIDISTTDVQGTIGALWIFPIKSCGGVAVTQARLLPTGLEWDRAWMVVDMQGQFITQRQVPQMALVQPQIDVAQQCLHVRFAHQPDLQLPLALPWMQSAMQRSVQVWQSQVLAWDEGDVAAQWFSQALGLPCRLVRFDPAKPRLTGTRWTGGLRAPHQFADGYPLLVTTSAAVDALNRRLHTQGHAAIDGLRFRANVVIDGLAAHEEDFIDTLWVQAEQPLALRMAKPCTRCPVPDIDPVTARKTPFVSDALANYRQDARMGGAVTFGMNAVVALGAGQVLHTGQRIGGILRFDA